MNTKNVHLIYILLLLTGLFAGACRDEEDVVPRFPGLSVDTLERTLVIYMAAENNLHSYLQADSLEIAWGLDSLGDNSCVVLFMDDQKSSRLCMGTRKERLHTVKTYEGNLCSTDSQTMANVLHDIFTLYPARTYGLVMCSHASGWLFDNPVSASQMPRRRSFGIDNGQRSSSNSGRKMNIPTLAGVLSGCPHLDFLMFDACFMQCIEVAYELRHSADYIIASPAEIPATGAPFTELLPIMCTAPTDIRALAECYVDYYQEGMQSSTYGGAELTVVRTDKLRQLAQVTAPLMNRLLADSTELDIDGVQRYYPDLASSYYTGFFDLKHLIYTHLDSLSYESWVKNFDETVPVQALSPQWYSAYNWGVKMYVRDIPHTGGVSIYVPRSLHKANGWLDAYHGLQWYEDTGMNITKW